MALMQATQIIKSAFENQYYQRANLVSTFPNFQTILLKFDTLLDNSEAF